MNLHIIMKTYRIFFKNGPNGTAQKMKFPADSITFTEEIVNEKLHFLCRVK